MLTCPKCHAGNPAEMRFCLQCGVALAPPPAVNAPPPIAHPPVPAAPTAPPADHYAPAPPAVEIVAPKPPQRSTATVPLKISPTPVMAPRDGHVAEHPRPRASEPLVDVDEELLKKSFERPVAHPGAVVCRFCKGPLDIEGDFCEQCGAPVAEAAPPGVVIPKPPAPPPPPPLLDDDPLAAPTKIAPPAPPPGSPTGPHRIPTPPPAAKPVQHAEPVHSTPPPRTPTPYPPTPQRPSVEEEPSSGLVGRLKGLFKKG
jgi:hypothetical protein